MQSISLKGFTLIELMIVVTLIGIIAVFAIPNYTKSVAKSYEKTGSNNLLIMYSAQKLYKNNGNAYADAANVGDVNTNLNLNIIATGFTYACDGDAGGFECTAVKTGGGGFTLKITDADSTVCCDAGTCPSAPACT